MTGIGRVAYHKMVDAVSNGDLTINEGLAAVIKACEEIEGHYEIKGQKVPLITKARDRIHKTYNYIHNLMYA
jgi:hypothetical protein